MNTDAVLRLARAISPRGSRERRFEEWLADAAGCDELGLSRTGVAAGALRLATEARARLLLSLVAGILMRTWPVGVGVLLGAVCAVCSIPVLTVVALALLLQGGTLALTQWRSQTRLQPHRAGINE